MTNSLFKQHWHDAAVVDIWSERATIQCWFDVEAALAKAQAELGMIPTKAAAVIAEKANAAEVDLERLVQDIGFALHPFVPALRQLEEICGEEAAAFLHWGATTQNIFDTATSLQLQRSDTLLRQRLERLLAKLAEIADAHRTTVQAGRTHGQHALPISFGLKIAAWIAELRRHMDRLRALEERVFIVRMGGAAGTYAAMDGHGRAIQARVAKLLGLHDGGLPMRSSADHFAEYVCVLAQFAATSEKIAQNISFLQRTEIGEAFEGHHDGKIGSSTMPQKRNPARGMIVITMARLLRLRAPAALDAMVQMDEADGAISGVCEAVVPEAAIMAVSIAMQLELLFAGLQIDAGAMRENIDKSRGLIMTEAAMMRLAPKMGRDHAHRLLYDVAMAAFEQRQPLLDALKSRHDIDGVIDIEATGDPSTYLGESADCVDAEVHATRTAAK
jgi:3-carboxy-cis,cis-muconate cycloisomerase